MKLDLTATPIIVADGGGRLIYKNAAAKKAPAWLPEGNPVSTLSFGGRLRLFFADAM